ncbi:semaphorin-4E-like [Petromyzon marinus]|uniref:semaphorin-4E-like n=1 Tax=Petromyzon marinus TaxID=7757 RepID=UPI003F703532
MGPHGGPIFLSLLLLTAVATLGSEFNLTAGPRVSVPQRELKGVLVWTDPSVGGNSSVVGGSSQLLELEGLLLLGGRDAIHVLNASNVSRPVAPPIVWAPSLSEKSECSSKGPMMEECANYIRVLHRLNDSHLFTCGTHAFNPQCIYIRTTPRPLQLLPAMEAGRGRCPYSRSQGAASVVLDGELYTATSNNFLSTEYVVARSLGGRTPLKTELLNDWLSHPDFVFLGAVRESEDSEDGDDDKVYVFFSERDRDTRAMVASVARVCKGDLGGLKALQKRWSSFLKARVECTLPGSLGPLQKIRSVFYHQPGPSWRDGLFYGVFESQGPWGPISALCPLPVSRLRAVFQGPYREFHSNSMCWSARSTNIPSPRPGSCITDAMRARGIKNSTDLPEQTLTFALEHPLMAQAVTPEGAAGPVLVAPPGLRYTQVALLRVLDAKGAPRDLVYLGTDSGLLHKALLGPPGQPAYIIEELNLFSDPQPISSLQISHDKTRLFVVSGSAVAQVALGGAACGRYPSCTDCVLARDPTCAWDANLGCVGVLDNRGYRIQDVENGDVGECTEKQATPTVTPVLAALRGSAFLPCPMPSAHAHARWLHEGRQLRRPPPSEAPAWRALPDGLLLLALGRERSGVYECSALERRSHRAIAAFSLTVSDDALNPCRSEGSRSALAGGGAWEGWVIPIAAAAATAAAATAAAAAAVAAVRRWKRSRRVTIGEEGRSYRPRRRRREQRQSRVPLVGSEDVALLASYRVSQRHSAAPQFAGVDPPPAGTAAPPDGSRANGELRAKRRPPVALPLPPPPLPPPPAVPYRERLVKVAPRHGGAGRLSIVAGRAHENAPLPHYGSGEEGAGDGGQESTV